MKSQFLILFLSLSIVGISYSYLLDGPAFCAPSDIKPACPSTGSAVIGFQADSSFKTYTTPCQACNKKSSSFYFLNACNNNLRTATCTNKNIPACGISPSGLTQYASDCAACAAGTKVTQFFHGTCPKSQTTLPNILTGGQSNQPASNSGANSQTVTTNSGPSSLQPSANAQKGGTTQTTLNPSTSSTTQGSSSTTTNQATTKTNSASPSSNPTANLANYGMAPLSTGSDSSLNSISVSNTDPNNPGVNPSVKLAISN